MKLCKICLALVLLLMVSLFFNYKQDRTINAQLNRLDTKIADTVYMQYQGDDPFIGTTASAVLKDLDYLKSDSLNDTIGLLYKYDWKTGKLLDSLDYGNGVEVFFYFPKHRKDDCVRYKELEAIVLGVSTEPLPVINEFIYILKLKEGKVLEKFIKESELSKCEFKL